MPDSLESKDSQQVVSRDQGGVAAVGSLVFLVAYLLVSPVAGALSTGDMPLPDAPGAGLLAFYQENREGTWVAAALQAVSVLGFGGFALAVLPALRRSMASIQVGRLKILALLSVLAMLVSSVLAALLSVVAQDGGSAETISAVRMASFWAGGVVNVATLGGFVFVVSRHLHRQGLIGRRSSVLGTVAGVLAMLSVLSLAIYYANAFLPLGRTLSMVWTVVVGIVLVRHSKRAAE